MRGKGYSCRATDPVFGITPAYAGKRDFRKVKASGIEDHPRLCGEKDSPLLNSTLILGSPPPMRGKDSRGILSDLLCRITPAYAGKSYDSIRKGFFQKDHPRLCGEKLSFG